MKDMINKLVLDLEENEEMKDAFNGLEPLSKGRWEIVGMIDEISEGRVVISVKDVTELSTITKEKELPDVPESAPVAKILNRDKTTVLGGPTAAINPNP